MTIAKFLDSITWPETLKTSTEYSRTHDDTDGDKSQRLAVAISHDGDLWIKTWHRHMLRFRMPGMGGGLSPRTRAALLVLAEAIRLDNEERPI